MRKGGDGRSHSAPGMKRGTSSTKDLNGEYAWSAPRMGQEASVAGVERGKGGREGKRTK